MPHVEVERTFSPPDGAVLPALTDVHGVTAAEPAGEAVLDATYYDTVDMTLLAAGVTLRRRSGGPDEGWHLKLPAGAPGAREELHRPLGEPPEPPPAELLWLVDGWTRGTAVAPVARIRTARSTTRLVGPDGRVVAELVDDQVEGQPARLGQAPRRWREWEIELVEGDAALLDAAEELFARHGITRSRVQRKIAQVLGEPDAGAPTPRKPSPKRPARLLLHARLAEQVRELGRLDPVVRRGGEGGVHGLRKACRRLRSALATYRPLFDRELTDPVREELQWLSRSLSDVRDAEVVVERIAGLAAELDDGLVVGPVAERLESCRTRTREHGASVVAEVLGSDRYRALRAELDRLADEPPWTGRAEKPAREVLPKRVRREWKRLRRIRRDAEDPHDVRKGAKRLRYGYEVLEPLWPGRTGAPIRAAKELTQVLGERQDTLVAREVLVELAAEATRAGESSFTYGRLHAEEESRAAALLEEADRVWRRLRKARW